MRRAAYCLLLVLLLLAGNQPAQAQGWGDWQHQTPGGGTMGNPGGWTFLQLKAAGTPEIRGVRRWYFYKSRVIGQTDDAFFVADEADGRIRYFQSAADQDTYLSRHRLVPGFWTRWYDDNWVTLDTWLYLAVVLFFVSLPLLGVFGWLCYKAIRQERFSLKKPYTLVVLGLLGGFCLLMLLEQFPQSI